MRHPIQEPLRIREQSRLDRLYTAKARNQSGQFATPFELAYQIVEYTRTLWSPSRRIDFLEPAMGTGAFYSALKAGFDPAQIASATGVELDPQIADAANQIWKNDNIAIHHGDFTQLDPSTLSNLILTNPPYVRHHHLSLEQKHTLQARVHHQLGLRVSGLAGFYVYFLLLADRWLAEDGLSVWLVPSEFMDVNYGAVLRHYYRNR
jgi:methylase of polypeptide subunit release factors